MFVYVLYKFAYVFKGLSIKMDLAESGIIFNMKKHRDFQLILVILSHWRGPLSVSSTHTRLGIQLVNIQSYLW
jgi:hypothetical protein